MGPDEETREEWGGGGCLRWGRGAVSLSVSMGCPIPIMVCMPPKPPNAPLIMRFMFIIICSCCCIIAAKGSCPPPPNASPKGSL